MTMKKAMNHVSATEKEVVEWTLTSEKRHFDPFNELEVDVIISHESGESWRVPAFWSGNDRWRARFAPPINGHYTIPVSYTHLTLPTN